VTHVGFLIVLLSLDKSLHFIHGLECHVAIVTGDMPHGDPVVLFWNVVFRVQWNSVH